MGKRTTMEEIATSIVNANGILSMTGRKPAEG